MSGLLPMKLNDFLKIAEDNNRTIWYFEQDDYFELCTASENVIAYTEMPKEGLNLEKMFSEKVFQGSKELPVSIIDVNSNFNGKYLKKIRNQKASSIPKHEEEKKTELQYIEGVRPKYHTFPVK